MKGGLQTFEQAVLEVGCKAIERQVRKHQQESLDICVTAVCCLFGLDFTRQKKQRASSSYQNGDHIVLEGVALP